MYHTSLYSNLKEHYSLKKKLSKKKELYIFINYGPFTLYGKVFLLISITKYIYKSHIFSDYFFLITEQFLYT
ncbi:hypothetical protein PFTANZ_06033 [Plasmodium falciparum Tanzania (2000708)]|uniref:Uncharacterized protein n=2 Tax=Plasmodium falciparum TaxID=5833 RepID=A0A024VY50_PLAFA|nr:hypothetical protein PFTANZ_06033 [Plasmodium falciparum Tanzania (2000708)]ETW58126.1 hypothetical protein PFMC_05977 [Plasmodium falciparum CAMP/Malaysia]